LDTEFNEDGRTIELISLALVAEDGQFYYAVSSEFDPTACNDFVREQVLPQLPSRDLPNWKARREIAEDVREILLRGGSEKPEIWGYFADYDWVALCQLFGRMVDLPKGFPFWCRDLKQLMQDRGVEKDLLPPQKDGEHDALADARWIRTGYLSITKGVVSNG